MKLSALHQSHNARRTNRPSPPDPSVDAATLKSPSSILWLLFHFLCCLISLLLGFRFSRLLSLLLLSSFPNDAVHKTLTLRSPANLTFSPTNSRVVVGRHGILIRPWPHPDPAEVIRAHRIIDRVQAEQRVQYGVRNPRTVIAITPTYVRTFQALHLSGVMHSLMNLGDVVWIVVEAGGTTNETASLVAKSGLRVVHVGFEERMPGSWEGRLRVEDQMRIRALRVVRDQKMDGIVMFADDSNMHSMELFDEIQKVKWIGAVSVGILAHSDNSAEELSVVQKEEDVENSPMPLLGPACNSSDQLVSWHTFNSMPYVGKSAKHIGDMGIVLPRKLEWAGFVLNSRLFWDEIEDKPELGKDLETVSGTGDEIESPISLLKDPSVVEPLGSCGRQVLLWWLRVEARSDSKFPSRWIIDSPLEVTVPTKRTPWPDAPLELPSHDTMESIQENTEKQSTKTRAHATKRSSRSKRKREARVVDTQVRHSGEK
ncbi:hypothetical protein RHMOL_Rhmol10G0145300 [Rhododendron molle]|uniref:Uncharacterized protein n=1 Tax=Rhododendron molle TaxID=49168 RepID=A0ACC0M3C9_RHOML|nr:hypothetical protein RHMOL_Rhmol10G0145300 [Rhododendron molle]